MDRRAGRFPEAVDGYRATLELGMRQGLFSAPRQISAMLDQLGTWVDAGSGTSWFAGLVSGGTKSLRTELDAAATSATAAVAGLRGWIRDVYALAAADTPDAVGRERYHPGAGDDRARRQRSRAVLHPAVARFLPTGPYVAPRRAGTDSLPALVPDLRLVSRGRARAPPAARAVAVRRRQRIVDIGIHLRLDFPAESPYRPAPGCAAVRRRGRPGRGLGTQGVAHGGAVAGLPRTRRSFSPLAARRPERRR